MSEAAIIFENISKQYRLGQIGTGTLSHDLNRWWHKVRGHEDPYLKIGTENDRSSKADSDYVWALKDINIEVEQGEVLGIIGKNGAGKSTLLKLLSKVTKPTTGVIKAKGRIASLLEIGTGFHPEMTGRENVFMNGSIMGMTRVEIRQRFDEIVDFAGVERYIDTPVKRYSSGMMVRLGFAIAAHLEPEILVVDEVLAVGDAEFQKKAIGKMQDVSRNNGRTVLFVSHNLAAVNQLCPKCLLLKNGRISLVGNTDTVISQYLRINGDSDVFVDLSKVKCKRLGNKKTQFLEIWLNKKGVLGYNRLFSIGDDLIIGLKINFIMPNENFLQISIAIRNSEGIKIANMANRDSNFNIECKNKGVFTYNIVLEDIRLYPGTYYLSIWSGDMSSVERYDYIEDCISFEIIDGGGLTTRKLPSSAGLFFLTPQWIEINS